MHAVAAAPAESAGPSSVDGSACYALLHTRFRVTCASDDLQADVDRLLGWSRVPTRGGEPTYALTGPSADVPRFELRLDGQLLASDPDRETVLGLLQWQTMRRAVDDAGAVVVHAGVVVHDGRALVLPAPSGTGKTTLVAALVRAGFDYLSDELAVLRPPDGHVEPFPAPLSIKDGSVPLLASRVPGLEHVRRGSLAGGRPVPAGMLRPDALGDAAPIGWVVCLDGHGPAPSALRPCTRPAALAAMAANTFGLRDRGRDGFELLARAVEPARCYRLRAGPLDDAVERIRHLVVGDVGST